MEVIKWGRTRVEKKKCIILLASQNTTTNDRGDPHTGQFKKLSLIESEKIQVDSTDGIRTHDLCDAGAVLHQLSYKATQFMEVGHFVGLMCSR